MGFHEIIVENVDASSLCSGALVNWNWNHVWAFKRLLLLVKVLTFEGGLAGLRFVVVGAHHVATVP